MGWLYLVIAILVLVGAVLTAAAWFFGCLTALAVFGVIGLIFYGDLSASDATTSVVTVMFDRGKFLFRIDEPELIKRIRRYYPSHLVYGISLTVTVLIIIKLLASPRLSDEDRALTVVGAIIAPMIVAGFAAWLNPTENLKKLARSVTMRKVARLNTAGSDYPDLEQITAEIQHTSGQLGIALDRLPTEQAAAEIRSRTHDLLRDPSVARSIVLSCAARGRADVDGLRTSVSLLEQVTAEHRRVSPLVFTTGSRSYLESLDFVLVTLQQAKAQLLPRREWQNFASVSSDLLAQLSDLERTATAMADSGPRPENDETDPYRTLNVPRGATLEQVKRVYRSLVHIYHEAKDTRDPEKWQAINSAYSRICQELGERG